MLEGLPIYPPLDAVPFAINQYTPLFYWLAGGIASFVGVEPGDLDALYRVGRTISVVSALLLAGALYGAGRRLFDLSPLWSAVASLSVFTGLFPWNVTARSDCLYLLLGTAAVMAHLRFLREGRAVWQDCAAALLVLAFFAKQSAIIFAAGIVVSTLICVPRPLLIHATVPSGAIALAGIGGLLLVLGLGVLDHIVDGVRNGRDLELMVRRAWLPFVAGKFWLIGAWVMGVIVWWRQGNGDPCIQGLVTISTISLVLGAAMSSKFGAAENYFLEFMITASLLAALWCAGIWREKICQTALLTAVIAVAVFGVNYGFFSGTVDRILNETHVQAMADAVDIRKNYLGRGERVFTLDLALILHLKDVAIMPQISASLSSAGAGAYDIEPVKTWIASNPVIAVVEPAFCGASATNDSWRPDWVDREFTSLLAGFRHIGELSGGKCVLRGPG